MYEKAGKARIDSAIFAVGMIAVAMLMLSLLDPADMTAAQLAAFDPVEQGFAGLEVAEVTLAVLGVLVITGEWAAPTPPSRP